MSDMTMGDLLLATFFYFALVGISYFVVFLAVTAALVLFCGGKISVAGERAFKVGVFLCLLLFFGGIGEVVWTSSVAGRLYYTPDYTFGYLPFVPITQGELDMKFGEEKGALLNGATLGTVNMVWVVITAFVWGAAVFSYRALFRRGRAVQPAVPVQLAER